MARTKSFDPEHVMRCAARTFATFGYAGSSAQMLTEALGIGRQSLYDTFGDKWTLYIGALRQYTEESVDRQIRVLRGGSDPLSAITAHLHSFAEDAVENPDCLGLSSTAEFGSANRQVADINHQASSRLTSELTKRVREAQALGLVGGDLRPREAAQFLVASLSSIKLTARAGGSADAVKNIVTMTLRTLR